MIIIFEGPDGSGRTSLFKALAKARNYEDTYIDRMFVSDIVYAMMNDKFFLAREKIVQLRLFVESFKPLHIVLSASREQIETAIIMKNEQFSVENYIGQEMRFRYFSKMFLKNRVVYLDRTNKTIKECVKIILKEIKKHEQ